MINTLRTAFVLITIAILSSCSSSTEVEPLDENLVFEEESDFSEEVEDLDFSGADADELEEFTIEEDELDESFDTAQSDSEEEFDDGLSFDDFEEDSFATEVETAAADELSFDDEADVEIEEDLSFEEDLAFDTPQDQNGDIALSLPKESKPAKNKPESFSNKIESIDYFTEVAGGAFSIKTSEMPRFRTEYVPDTNQFVLTILDAEISKRLNRPFLTKDFRQSFKSMSSYQDGEGAVRFVFKLSDGIESQPKVITEEDGVVVRVAEALKTYAKKGESLGGVDGEVPLAQDALGEGGSTLDDLLLNKIKFKGRPISIQAKNEEVVNIINFISEDVGANIIVSDSVKGTISLKLNQVPWDQALVVIMKAKGLGYVRNGNVLRIASLPELKTEALAAEEVAKSNEKWAPYHVKVFPLSYAKPQIVEEKIKPFLTIGQGEGGTGGGQVISEERSSSLIIRDRLDVIKNVAKLIKEMDQPPLQVMIRAKIVEANKNLEKELGSRFGISFNSTTVGSNPSFTGSAFLNDRGQTNGQLNVLGLDFFGNLSQTIRISELESTLRVLSSPSVMAINNEKAVILQSDQVLTPQIIQAEGGNVLGNEPPATFEREEVELRLEVTPQVSSDGNVIMDLLVKRQVAGNPVNGVRPISTREAQTKVIVGNNKTAMIGGVYQTRETGEKNGVPVLRKIPLLKWLFGREFSEKTDNELVIFITPKVINAKGAQDPLSPSYQGGAADFTAKATKESL